MRTCVSSLNRGRTVLGVAGLFSRQIIIQRESALVVLRVTKKRKTRGRVRSAATDSCSTGPAPACCLLTLHWVNNYRIYRVTSRDA